MLYSVHVISRKALKDFTLQHPASAAALDGWYRAVKKGAFSDFAALKAAFKSVDYVKVGKKGLYVFNLGGNNYRIVAAIHFKVQRLFIRVVLTHADYTKDFWKRTV
jgi:mRNA interferase HigB